MPVMSQSRQDGTLPVIVIGSGMAGLAAAFRLTRAGCKVKIIEAAHAVGGKLRSKSRDGFLIDQGAFFLPSTYTRMMALAVEAGFADQIDVGGSLLAVARDNELHEIDPAHGLRDFVRTRLFSLGTKLSLVKLASEIGHIKRASYERIPELGALDIETAAAWGRRELGDELTEYVVGLVLRGMAGSPLAQTSRVEFPALLALFAGAQLMACRGGFGAFAAHLAANIEVELKATASEVIQQGDGVRVTWKDSQGVEHVDTVAGCVVAGSTETVIDIVPGLDAWRRDYLGRSRDKRSFILNVALSRPPARLAATYLVLPAPAHPFLGGICADHHKAPGRVPAGKGMLSLMPVWDWCEPRFHNDDDSIVRETLASLDTLLPGVADSVEFAEVARWSQRYNPVGHYRELGRFRAICDADSNIQLAGDYFSYTNMESATRSGEAAAQRLRRALQPGKSGASTATRRPMP